MHNYKYKAVERVSMSSDQWQIVDTVQGNNKEFDVSTVELPTPYGANYDRGYETCLFWDDGSYVVQRYETQDEAVNGHENIVEWIEEGLYSMQEKEVLTTVKFKG